MAAASNETKVKYILAKFEFVLYDRFAFCYGWMRRDKGILALYMYFVSRVSRFRSKIKFPGGYCDILKPGEIAGTPDMLREFLECVTSDEAMQMLKLFAELGLIEVKKSVCGEGSRRIVVYKAMVKRYFAASERNKGFYTFKPLNGGTCGISKQDIEILRNMEGYTFTKMDAWLDLSISTVLRDDANPISHIGPVVFFDGESPIISLRKIAARWGWNEHKVHTFLKKYSNDFKTIKLGGNRGSVIFNINKDFVSLYNVDTDVITDETVVEAISSVEEYGKNMRGVNHVPTRGKGMMAVLGEWIKDSTRFIFSFLKNLKIWADIFCWKQKREEYMNHREKQKLHKKHSAFEHSGLPPNPEDFDDFDDDEFELPQDDEDCLEPRCDYFAESPFFACKSIDGEESEGTLLVFSGDIDYSNNQEYLDFEQNVNGAGANMSDEEMAQLADYHAEIELEQSQPVEGYMDFEQNLNDAGAIMSDEICRGEPEACSPGEDENQDDNVTYYWEYDHKWPYNLFRRTRRPQETGV